LTRLGADVIDSILFEFYPIEFIWYFYPIHDAGTMLPKIRKIFEKAFIKSGYRTARTIKMKGGAREGSYHSVKLWSQLVDLLNSNPGGIVNAKFCDSGKM
jgi:hypothetical protein